MDELLSGVGIRKNPDQTAFNSETTQQQKYADFDGMLVYLKESKTLTADQGERGLFKQLVAMGLCYYGLVQA